MLLHIVVCNPSFPVICYAIHTLKVSIGIFL
jgi:hypothetical protein